MSTKKSKTKEEHADLLAPVTDEMPCGSNLEYDPEFLMLFSKATEQPEAQYGDFVTTPESISWNEVERDTLRLLLRTKDIRVYILLLRSKTQLQGAQGMRDGLGLLFKACATYPETIHPQATGDEEITADEAALVRGNALAALIDPEGVLADIRGIVLSNNAALRLQVRDVERALAIPRPADALSPDSVRRQLLDLRQRGNAALTAFDEAYPIVEQLQQWANESIQDAAPDLQSLRKLLGYFQSAESRGAVNRDPVIEDAGQHGEDEKNSPLKTETAIETSAAVAESIAVDVPAAMQPEGIADRYDALQRIEDIRCWFEAHEPSSPTIPLLRQAERMVGKRFSEVIEVIPLELLQKWDAVES